MKHLILAITLFATVLQACAPLGVGPRVTRRYASRVFSPADTTIPAVRLAVFSTVIPRTGTETVITNLAERGQAELIRAMAGRTVTAQSLAEAMAYPVRRPAPLPALRDLTTLSRRLVFSIDNGSLEPADRVSTARIRVILRDSARFTGWDRIITRFDTVNLGAITTDQKRTAGAELGLTLPVFSAAPTVKSSSESSLHEEVELRQRRVALTGALADSQAVLAQQGAAGIDLMGNTTADFEISAKRLKDERVTVAEYPQADGTPACTIGPRLQSQMQRIPDSSPIRVNVYLEYVLRRVTRGQETVTESDDAVMFIRGRDSVMNVTLIPGEMLEHAVFQLRVRTGATGSGSDPFVHVSGMPESGIDPGPVLLQFADYDNAMGMLRWLRNCKGMAAGYTLMTGDRGAVLSERDVERLYIWRNQFRPLAASDAR